MDQVHGLYAHRALSAGPAAPRLYAVWLAAAAAYFVASYPFQGVIYSWCGDFAQVVYVVLGIVGTAALLVPRVPNGRPYRIAFAAAVGALTLSMLVTLAAYANVTVVREFLLLTVIAATFRTTAAGDMKVMRAFVLITAVAFVPAFCATALFYAHWIDWPSWSVAHLHLAAANPLMTRQYNEGFEYYLPLWVSVVPNTVVADQGFGLHFVRQSFLYTEPSDVWYFVAGPFWVVLADTRMPARAFCLAVLGVALALSFSVFGILVTAAGFMFAAAVALGGRWLAACVAVAILGVLAFVPLLGWVQMLGSNKAEELSFYAQNITVFSDLTLLGHAASQEQVLSYGFLAVLYRYGIVGFSVTLCVALCILWAAFRVLGDAAALGWRRFPLFMACFVSVGLLIKGTSIVPTMAVLSLAGTLGCRQGRLVPLAALAAR